MTVSVCILRQLYTRVLKPLSNVEVVVNVREVSQSTLHTQKAFFGNCARKAYYCFLIVIIVGASVPRPVENLLCFTALSLPYQLKTIVLASRATGTDLWL